MEELVELLVCVSILLIGSCSENSTQEELKHEKKTESTEECFFLSLAKIETESSSNSLTG
jgi:hypothetical protein